MTDDIRMTSRDPAVGWQRTALATTRLRRGLPHNWIKSTHQESNEPSKQLICQKSRKSGEYAQSAHRRCVVMTRSRQTLPITKQAGLPSHT